MKNAGHPPEDTSLGTLITALIDIGGPLSGIVAHMASSPTAPTQLEIRTRLFALLHPTCAELAKRYSGSELRSAATIVDEICDVVCKEIYLVPHKRPQPHRGTRRPRR